MEEYTVQQFQENFDKLFQRVENGETFKIRDGNNIVMIIPYQITKDIDEIVRIYTDHEEGS